MAEEQINILLTAKDQVTGILGKVRSSLSNAMKPFTEFGTLLSGGVVAVGLTKFITQAEEQESAIAGLSNTLKQLGVNYDTVAGEVEGVTTALQTKTGVADEEQLRVLNKLILVTGDYQKSIAALPLVLDLAAASGSDVESAARGYSAALEGDVTMLSRTFPLVKVLHQEGKTAAEIMAILTERTNGAAEALARTQPLKMMKVAIGEVAESIGRTLLPYMKMLTDFFINLPPTLQKVIVALPLIAGGITLITVAISTLTKLSAPLLVISGIIAGWGIAFKVAGVKMSEIPFLFEFAVKTITGKARVLAVEVKAAFSEIKAHAEYVWNFIRSCVTLNGKAMTDAMFKHEQDVSQIEKKRLFERKVISDEEMKWDEDFYKRKYSGETESAAGSIAANQDMLNKLNAAGLENLADIKDIEKKKTLTKEEQEKKNFETTGELYEMSIRDKKAIDEEKAASDKAIWDNEVALNEERLAQRQMTKEQEVEWIDTKLALAQEGSAEELRLQNDLSIAKQELWAQDNAVQFELCNITKDLFRNMAGSIANNLMAVWKGAKKDVDALKAVFQSMGDFILQVIAQLIAKTLAWLALTALANIFTGGVGGFFAGAAKGIFKGGAQTFPGDFRRISAPPMRPVPILAHGGEIIGRPEAGVGGMTLVFNAPVFNADETMEAISIGLHRAGKRTGLTI